MTVGHEFAGVIVEDGTHEELLARDGHYANMWKMQAGGFLPEIEGESSVESPYSGVRRT